MADNNDAKIMDALVAIQAQIADVKVNVDSRFDQVNTRFETASGVVANLERDVNTMYVLVPAAVYST